MASLGNINSFPYYFNRMWKNSLLPGIGGGVVLGAGVVLGSGVVEVSPKSAKTHFSHEN